MPYAGFGSLEGGATIPYLGAARIGSSDSFVVAVGFTSGWDDCDATADPDPDPAPDADAAEVDAEVSALALCAAEPVIEAVADADVDAEALLDALAFTSADGALPSPPHPAAMVVATRTAPSMLRFVQKGHGAPTRA